MKSQIVIEKFLDSWKTQQQKHADAEEYSPVNILITSWIDALKWVLDQ